MVIDWEGEDSSDLLQKIWRLTKCKKPTILAVSAKDYAMPGVHVLLKKPVTLEASKSSLKTAYTKMLIEHRRHVRHPLMTPLVATAQDGTSLPITVIDIGDGGIGLTSKEILEPGEILSFRLQLPGTPREILLQVRILWTREYGRFGSEFLRIPPVDLIMLHDWLRAKQNIKKPINPL
ncbi:MAG TPA: PilZ domain-containing protein [Candidatus Sulfotelmatobacter sp.]|nr:PilZ domain-containing protein [Candidatus Sulfotelmatobacter sp.]